MSRPDPKFLEFLRNISKKGFLEILLYVESHPETHYNQVLKNSIEKKILSSSSSVTLVMNSLTDIGMLERTIADTRPIRTTYYVTEKGKRVIKLLKNVEKETK